MDNIRHESPTQDRNTVADNSDAIAKKIVDRVITDINARTKNGKLMASMAQLRRFHMALVNRKRSGLCSRVPRVCTSKYCIDFSRCALEQNGVSTFAIIGRDCPIEAWHLLEEEHNLRAEVKCPDKKTAGAIRELAELRVREARAAGVVGKEDILATETYEIRGQTFKRQIINPACRYLHRYWGRISRLLQVYSQHQRWERSE